MAAEQGLPPHPEHLVGGTPLRVAKPAPTRKVWPRRLNAHAGSRTRVTSMGGLYDTATLRALTPVPPAAENANITENLISNAASLVSANLCYALLLTPVTLITVCGQICRFVM